MEYRNVTDRQTDGQRDRIVISISRVSVLTRDKNRRSVQTELKSSAAAERPCDGATECFAKSLKVSQIIRNDTLE